jgi:hypothetical protein
VSKWDPKANDIFLRAIEITAPEDRGPFLDAACAADPALRERVEALVRSHEQAGEFLGRPIPEQWGGFGASGEATRTFPPDVGDAGLDFLAPSDKPGSLGRLGHYEVQAVVGRGGMGIVLKAFDENLHRVVAIKAMAPQLAAVATARQRFTREARAQAAVTHEHVVTIHAVEAAGDRPYIVMQYVAGVSLQDRLDATGPLRLPEVLRIGAQAAGGLAAAHAQGLVHRDVKPANILLENGVERVKLTDFGLARAADDASLTQSGVIAGTPQYMSPEQAEGKPVDARSDLFSLGSVLYATCAGRPPFRAGTSVAVLKRVCEETATPIREINPDVPDWLAAVIAKLHAKDPAERFRSATEVADLLGQHLANVQHPSVVPLPAQQVAPVRPVRRRRRWAAAAAVLVLLFAGLGTTEATGVTKLRATVIRIFTPDGTLVVEAADPDLKVAIEGNGDLVITGAGVKEVRLAPGSYKLRATKDGKPVALDRDLVTIARGDTQVVRVRIEKDAAPVAVVAPKTEGGAFVVLGGQRVAERRFDTLADAVQHAGNGDTIEVRGSGPFVSTAIPLIQGQRLTIRAGAGTRPVFRWEVERLPPQYKQVSFLSTDSDLVLEGLEFQVHPPSAPAGPGITFLPSLIGGPLRTSSRVPDSIRVANCRFLSLLAGGSSPLAGIDMDGIPLGVVRNCEFIGRWSPHARVGNQRNMRPQLIVMENCAFAGDSFYCLTVSNSLTDQANRVRLTHNTFTGTSGNRLPSGSVLALSTELRSATFKDKPWGKVFDVQASENVFDARSLFCVYYSGEKLVEGKADAEQVFRDLLEWKERANLYDDATDFFTMSGRNVAYFESRMKLKGWSDWWGVAATESRQGRVVLAGGNLGSRSKTLPEAITGGDFLLRNDSIGKGAGRGGRDPGVDVDLLGPGAAYERWKQTPEYQQWLQDSGLKK